MRRQVLLLIVLAACERRAAPRGGSGEAREHAGPSHTVEVMPPAPCTAGDPCAVAVRLTALGGYKVNHDYPFKFVPAPGSAVAIDPSTVVLDGTHAATVTVPFRADTAGTVRVAGKLRLSVCNADECKIEEEPVSIEIPIGA